MWGDVMWDRKLKQQLKWNVLGAYVGSVCIHGLFWKTCNTRETGDEATCRREKNGMERRNTWQRKKLEPDFNGHDTFKNTCSWIISIYSSATEYDQWNSAHVMAMLVNCKPRWLIYDFCATKIVLKNIWSKTTNPVGWSELKIYLKYKKGKAYFETRDNLCTLSDYPVSIH